MDMSGGILMENWACYWRGLNMGGIRSRVFVSAGGRAGLYHLSRATLLFRAIFGLRRGNVYTMEAESGCRCGAEKLSVVMEVLRFRVTVSGYMAGFEERCLEYTCRE